jgi:hypothetical protein
LPLSRWRCPARRAGTTGLLRPSSVAVDVEHVGYLRELGCCAAGGRKAGSDHTRHAVLERRHADCLAATRTGSRDRAFPEATVAR